MVAIFGGVFVTPTIAYAKESVEEEVDTVPYSKWNGVNVEEFSLLDSRLENSIDNPYIIDNANKFAYLRYQVSVMGKSYYGMHFKQTVNLDLGGDFNTYTGDINGHMWEPIGYYKNVSDNKPFRGNYDGGNHMIYGLAHRSYSDTSYYGLFGYTVDATIKNVNLFAYIYALGTNVGGLIGFAEDTTVSNCFVEFNSKGKVTNWGALIGNLYTTKDTRIYDCMTQGEIVSDNAQTATNISGMIGSANSNTGVLTLEGLFTAVYITSYNVVGGICGTTFGTLDLLDCVNSGNITANTSSNVGGIVGVNSCRIIDGCENHGEIISTGNYIGGITGNSAGKIINCRNIGHIKGDDYTGGIVGRQTNSTIECKNMGHVEGGNYTGGIAGEIFPSSDGKVFDKCYAAGIVEGDTYVGGLVGKITKVNMNYCFITKSNNDIPAVSANDFAGGLVAYVDNANIVNCYAVVDVKSGYIAGGLVARFNGTVERNELKNAYFIGKLTSKKSGGLVQNATYVNISKAYSVATLEPVGPEPVDYEKSGAVIGEFLNTSFTDVYFNTDKCSMGSGNNLAVEVAGVNTLQLRTEVYDINDSNFYIYPEEELAHDYYYDYYPTLKCYAIETYVVGSPNYFVNYTDVMIMAKTGVISAIYETVRIEFVTNCDTILDDIFVKQNQDLTDILPTLSKPGFVFKGWYLDKKFEAPLIAEAGLPTSDILYARFDYPEQVFPWWIFVVIIGVTLVALVVVILVLNRKRNISFKVEGLEIPNIKVKTGAKLELPNPKKSGYRFKGWYYNEELTKKFDLETMPNINLILFGEFKKVERKKKEQEKQTNEDKPKRKSKKKEDIENKEVQE